MVMILDTTLREGEQTPGVCFPTHIKAAIADRLDALGVDIIEAGHPAVTDEIGRAVGEIARRGLRARIGAHARSMKADVDLALERGASFLGIFYCVSRPRLGLHEISLREAVDRVAEVIRHARESRPDLMIRYTPEDTVRSDWTNVVTASVEAVQAGADVISVADTTGHMIPGVRSLHDYVSRLRHTLARRGLEPRIAVHCHNDRGLALANALDGYRAGAEILDASVLGLGERAGIVDLATLLAVLAADFGQADGWRLRTLPELYELVRVYARRPIPGNQPVTGRDVFTHCAGVHTRAALGDPLHYQSLDPAPFGRRPAICLDHMAGVSAVRHALEAIGVPDPEPSLTRAVLARVKEIGETGRVVSLTELRYLVDYLTNERPARSGEEKETHEEEGDDRDAHRVSAFVDA